MPDVLIYLFIVTLFCDKGLATLFYFIIIIITLAKMSFLP